MHKDNPSRNNPSAPWAVRRGLIIKTTFASPTPHAVLHPFSRPKLARNLKRLLCFKRLPAACLVLVIYPSISLLSRLTFVLCLLLVRFPFKLYIPFWFDHRFFPLVPSSLCLELLLCTNLPLPVPATSHRYLLPTNFPVLCKSIAAYVPSYVIIGAIRQKMPVTCSVVR
ncbi:hypothetical protein DM02DRAFT_47785 [Periconia macrospinosa]|uniref:Uncharacterized protein n=1 Tax=Periconia macrospinosa TaxID=97972 RepID=A0A2V1DKG5_9PLEO|nr:hypothetical protein DM02DRAFT_47785 [Periconia macrospinosa]